MIQKHKPYLASSASDSNVSSGQRTPQFPHLAPITCSLLFIFVLYLPSHDMPDSAAKSAFIPAEHNHCLFPFSPMDFHMHAWCQLKTYLSLPNRFILNSISHCYDFSSASALFNLLGGYRCAADVRLSGRNIVSNGKYIQVVTRMDGVVLFSLRPWPWNFAES